MATTTIPTLFTITLMVLCRSQFTFEGGEYKCEGDESCAGVTDSAEITNLICSGFASCYAATLDLTCGDEKCNIECGEEDACTQAAISLDRGAESVTCGEPRACQDAQLTLTDVYNGFKIECSDEEACKNVIIAAELSDTDSEAHMDEFQCDGESTCKHAQVSLNRLEKFSCEGYRACYEGDFNFVNVADNFVMQCEGDSSCRGADVHLTFDSGATQQSVESIECESSQACEYLSISIDNQSSDTVVIKELKCEGFQSCGYLSFSVSGDVEIEKCICEDPEPYACLCTSGLDAICNTFEGVW
eukprot:CAMPEP_0197022550 /NCGR_PEP_ID=MMETSP1384-20130603/3389_1 /TAXON_ID=29189 /ORGANISM="Ammonia sp." /LENGTH=301 /DNA_ID=CAMNT_0042450609 /DNA_START=62 /DNA_END=964 /DNA_ORIENTATION=+